MEDGMDPVWFYVFPIEMDWVGWVLRVLGTKNVIRIGSSPTDEKWEKLGFSCSKSWKRLRVVPSVPRLYVNICGNMA